MNDSSLPVSAIFAANRTENRVEVASRLRGAVEGHYPFVWRVIRRAGVREPDVDDCVQEVFLVFSRRLSFVQLGKEKGFLFYAALNVASHAKRSHSRRREDDASALDTQCDRSLLPDEAAEQQQARAELDRVLDHMPMDLRMVLVLHELEGATMAEIGEWLQMPAGTVASRLRRARTRFVSEIDRLKSTDRAGGT